MTIVTVTNVDRPYGVDTSRLGLIENIGMEGAVVKTTPDLFVIEGSDRQFYNVGLQTFLGSGLTYSRPPGLGAAVPDGGVITGWESVFAGTGAGFSMQEFSVPATTFAEWLFKPMGPGGLYAPNRVLFGGDDSITGGSGGDTLQGEAGNDTIVGGSGDDVLAGGTPFRVEERGGGPDPLQDGSNDLRGDDGNDSISGGAAFDDIHGNRGNDTAAGGAGDDWVRGGQGEDVLNGNLGNDTLYGDLGDDIVRGGQGDDRLSGGDGADWLSGDRGDDTVSGGAGADVFHIWSDAGYDRVLDFNPVEGDRIELDADDFIVRQDGGDTVIAIAGGATMVLIGVSATNWENWVFQ